MFNKMTSKEVRSDDYIEKAKEVFQRDQVVVFKNILSDAGRIIFFDEMKRLKSHLVKRNIESEPTTHTPRKMSTLGSVNVRQYTSMIPLLYSDTKTLQWLMRVAGEKVYEVPDKNEDIVVNSLLEKGDIHGGHVDTYSFAFNFVYEFPEKGSGGELMLVKHSVDVNDLNSDRVSYHSFVSGDAYLLRTDLNVHGVSPMIKNLNRTVLNYAYASKDNREELSYSSSILYS